MKACRGSHKQEFQKLWRWRCSKAWPHLPNEVLRQAKVCLPVVTRPWPFLKHYMVYVKIRFKLRNLSVSSSSPPFVFSQTYSYSHDVHLSCHIKIIAKCAGEEEEQLLQVIFWKTPYMIVSINRLNGDQWHWDALMPGRHYKPLREESYDCNGHCNGRCNGAHCNGRWHEISKILPPLIRLRAPIYPAVELIALWDNRTCDHRIHNIDQTNNPDHCTIVPLITTKCAYSWHLFRLSDLAIFLK